MILSKYRSLFFSNDLICWVLNSMTVKGHVWTRESREMSYIIYIFFDNLINEIIDGDVENYIYLPSLFLLKREFEFSH